MGQAGLDGPVAAEVELAPAFGGDREQHVLRHQADQLRAAHGRQGGHQVVGLGRPEHPGRDQVHAHLDPMADGQAERAEVRAAEGRGDAAGRARRPARPARRCRRRAVAGPPRTSPRPSGAAPGARCPARACATPPCGPAGATAPRRRGSRGRPARRRPTPRRRRGRQRRRPSSWCRAGRRGRRRRHRGAGGPRRGRAGRARPPQPRRPAGVPSVPTSVSTARWWSPSRWTSRSSVPAAAAITPSRSSRRPSLTFTTHSSTGASCPTAPHYRLRGAGGTVAAWVHRNG